MSITIQKASDTLNVSRTTIYNHIKKFSEEESEKYLVLNKKTRNLTNEGLKHIKNSLAPVLKGDKELLEEKCVYISELEERLLERDYELQMIHKDHAQQLIEISKRHSEEQANLTQLLSNQQALTLQAQNSNEKQPLLARIFGTKKRDHTEWSLFFL